MSKRACILVPPCFLAPGLQAEANSNTSNWGIPFVEVALNNNIDIQVLPCTESFFGGLEVGFTRRRHGIDYYSNLPGYPSFCAKKASEAAEGIQGLSRFYNIIAIFGVEHSPSCAINYMYSHHGMLKESGLFMQVLQERLSEKNITIPFIGVNRNHPRKALTEFKVLIPKLESEGAQMNL